MAADDGRVLVLIDITNNNPKILIKGTGRNISRERLTASNITSLLLNNSGDNRIFPALGKVVSH